ncbi:MAG TPA: c-type cytochrome [Bordetella sp.]|nr:c-type cytochrome [Bordetella sp.]
METAAQAPPPTGSPDTVAGDAKAGQQLATQGVPASNVAACTSCHGAQGEGNAAAGFPRLAGQSANYLARQLADYAQGTRQNAVMAPIAKSLNESQRHDVAAYYAGLSANGAATGAGAQAAQTGQAAAGSGAVPAKGVEPRAPQPSHEGSQRGGHQSSLSPQDRGAQLVNVGDESIQVQACSNCHGPGAIGVFPAFPYLAGQHAGYITAALNEFKSGARRNDPSGQMPFIAKQLGDADMNAVAQYLSQLPPPSPDDERATSTQDIRERAAKGSASAHPSGSDKPAPQGMGTEQGAPTTGGTQGPGGGGGGSGTGSSGSGGEAPPQKK